MGDATITRGYPEGLGPKYLIRDNDGKYGSLFDQMAEASGIEIVKIPYRAPRAKDMDLLLATPRSGLDLHQALVGVVLSGMVGS